jgi:hypothetical protein
MRIPVEQQVIGILFSLTLLLVTIQLVRKHQLRERYALVWLGASLAIFILVVFDRLVGTLTFNSGEITKTFSVPVQDDSNSERDGSFLVSFSNPAGGLGSGPALAKATSIDDEAAQLMGRWSEVIPSQVVPIHMHLLPTGQVMFWDRHDDISGLDGHPRLLDPATGTITDAAMPTFDIFCSGHSFLADGSLLVTGGHIIDAMGEDKASIYNPFTDEWTQLPNMNAGRWYPSNVTLPNGDVLVMAGTYLSTTATPITRTSPGRARRVMAGTYPSTTAPITLTNTLPQVWQPSSNSWRNLTGAQWEESYPQWAYYYPFLYAAPNGNVFAAGPQQVARYLDTTGTGSWTDVAASTVEYREYGSSVMYDVGKILIVGGNPREPNPRASPTIQPSASAEVIDLNDDSPTWRAVQSMHFGRRHLNATLLPDGQVLVTGGSSAPGFDNSAGAVLSAEMWDPATETWSVMAAQTRYRGYHSTALLLPDGRVLVGGGGHPDPRGGAQVNFEIYSPPYLFRGPRPTITLAPAAVFYGQTFLVQTPDTDTIENVNWIRLGSVTHAFNQNQGINRLDFSKTSNGLTVTAPPEANHAPPGYYMLFMLNGSGVPSKAHIIRLGDNQE